MTDVPNGLAGALREAQLDVTEDAPLAPLTTFRIGGHARVLVTAHSPEEIVRAVRLAVEAGARWAVIGGGSNLLVADEGFPGVVVLVRAARVSLHDTELEAEAGAELGRIVTGSAWAGLGDLTFCAGIPGTVGGAVAGNAGAWGRAIGELVVAVRLLRAASMETVEVAPGAMDFGYRRSAVQASHDVVLAVRLGLQPTERKTMLKQIDENLARRGKRLPELPSAGSIFRNLPPAQPGGQREPAGRLLEAVGAKGYRVGDAGVTDRHANVIVNYGHARARDVVQLMAELERRVAEKYGVRLSRELRELG